MKEDYSLMLSNPPSSLWCHQESNRGHKDFQSFALPTELWHHRNVCNPWRKRRDSNSWYGCPYGSLANCWFQPLTHTSFRFAALELRCKDSTHISFHQILVQEVKKFLRSQGKMCTEGSALHHIYKAESKKRRALTRRSRLILLVTPVRLELTTQ